MTLRNLVLLPDPRLREVCEPITEINDDIRTLADDMLETMYDAPGIGLAAPQIGVLKRIVVCDVAERSAREDENANEEDAKPDPMVLINPEIVAVSDARSTYQEGCLSIPDIYEDVERPTAVRIKFTRLDGETEEQDVDGLLSVCLQHEIDHINGVLFIDHLSRLKRERITKKFVKLARVASR